MDKLTQERKKKTDIVLAADILKTYFELEREREREREKQMNRNEHNKQGNNISIARRNN